MPALNKLKVESGKWKVIIPLIVLAFSLLTSHFSLSPAYAQEVTPEPINKDNYKAPQNANYTLQNLQHGLLCELAGMSPAGRCIGMDKDKKLALYDRLSNGGAVGTIAYLIGTTYSQPLSTEQYLADLGQQLSLAKPAYAQIPGSGEGIIRPVLELWKVSRNLAYLAFVVIFVAIGVMIMFRQRVNPQTVVTAQAALPGLIIGIILITFSYFIAALITDLAFVGTRLAGEYFIQTNLPNAIGDAAKIREVGETSNIFQVFNLGSFRWVERQEIEGGVSSIIHSTESLTWATRVVTAIVLGIAGSIILGPFGAIGGVLTGGLVVGDITVPWVISFIVPLILTIALMVQAFRLLFSLIGAYIQILIATITGPFTIMLSSFPGQGGKLSGWWKSLLANALIFPAVVAAFLFAGLILETPANSWQTAPPLFAGLPTSLMKIIIAYGILLGTPSIPGIVRKAFGITGEDAFSQAATGGFLAGLALGRIAGVRGGRGAISMAHEGAEAVRGRLPVPPGSVQRWAGTVGGNLRRHFGWLRQPEREQ